MQHLLVARDFSPCSERALAVGLDLAARTDATLHLVHAEVLHGDPYGKPANPAGTLDKLRERLKEGVERDRDPTARYNPESVAVEHAVVRDVAAAPALLRYAEEHDVDLVVLGTHGRRGLRRAVLGSVAEEVARLAPCSVLAVRAGDEAFAPDTVLVAVDFSDGSRAALHHAARFAEVYGARLAILHVIEEISVPEFYDLGLVSVYTYGPEFDERALRHLRVFAEEALGEDVARSASYYVKVGSPAGTVVDMTEKVEADLVVVGTRGLSGVRRLLLGSVAERVLRLAPVPVFVARSGSMEER